MIGLQSSVAQTKNQLEQDQLSFQRAQKCLTHVVIEGICMTSVQPVAMRTG